jgi:HAD superfamily phosphoserine phosphatase-like hydrolase
MIKLAIYDMDKTITRRATFGPLIAHVIRHHAPWRIIVLPVMALTSLAYGIGALSRSRLKEINLRLLLGPRINPLLMGQIAETFADEIMATNLLGPAVKQISADREGGYRIILATASYRFYVDAIARRLDVTDVIATNLQEEGRFILPRIAGENCYDDGKLRMVKAWLSAQAIERKNAEIRFYSDHVSDAPCLTWADKAIATNAHPPLTKLAEQRGWSQLNWLSES